ncbi:MAG: hypothetical protein H6581_07125 [Bacteroidia bacterium]|nr:hypothetical protein [Bacteroidia bacterium]
MSIAELKTDLWRLISESNDPVLLQTIRDYLEYQPELSWESLPLEEREAMLDASEKAKKGIDIIPHEEVARKYGLDL